MEKDMKIQESFKTGQICPQTGFWKAKGTNIEIALSRKERFPPYKRKVVTWKLVRVAGT